MWLGTADSPYVIASADKLAQFAQTVARVRASSSDSAPIWTCPRWASGIPIGDEGAGTNLFQGSFDGMGHTISGLTTSRMMKDAEGNYQFPAAGAIRAYNYYPSDMALSATKQGNTRQITPPTGADSTEAALARDTLFPGTDMDRAVRLSDSL